MNLPFSGGCACGAIRYECTSEPIAMFRCHCRDCQRAGGGPYSAVVNVSKDAFRFTRGQPRRYRTSSESGGYNQRGFCAECGSRVSGGETDQAIGVLAGSLDEPSQFHAGMELFTADVQPWDTLNPEIPKFERYPPA